MYYIMLDPHDGDLLQLYLGSPGSTGFRSTFRLFEATEFHTLEDAQHMMNVLDLLSIQPDSQIVFYKE